MTHILISIKDLEKQLTLYAKGMAKHTGTPDAIKFQGKYAALDNVFDLGKQISLDETDINTKAYNHLAKLTEEELEFGTAELIINSYTQALKNLL